MHLETEKPGGSSHATEIPPSYVAASGDGLFDERISHVAAKYQGTTTDQHGQYETKVLL